MTITEAKKIIEMCADAVKKGDGEDAKIYVNKEYVLQILNMVENASSGFQPGIEPITPPNWPNWPPTWPQVWYKDSTDEPESPGPGFEKVPWWVWYKNPWGEFTCDSNSTGSKPQDADVVMTSADLQKFAEVHSKPEDYKNVTLTNREDVSPKRTDYIDDFAPPSSGAVGVKRTDYIDDWAGGSTTGGGSVSYTSSN